MTKEDIARVALGAPALHEVVIVSVPDCLLVKHWSRSGKEQAEDAAASLGNLFRTAQDALSDTRAGGEPDLLTLESQGSLVLLSRLNSEMVAGFVFDRTAPLGLVRVQARQLTDHLRQSAQRPKEETILQSSPPPTPSYRPPPPPSPSPPARPDLGAAVPSVTPASPAAAWSAPGPTVAPAAARPTGIPAADTNPSARPSIPAADTGSTRPRGVRLIEFFKRYAPDPHASMLRLSLRTGIPLDTLSHPEDLSEDQVEMVAASVRDILGQEQVNP